MIPYLFALALCLCRVDSISVCYSTVYVGLDNTQRAEKFHTDSLSSLDTDVKYFCAQHNIYHSECEAVRKYHTDRCFGEVSIHSKENEKLGATGDVARTSSRDDKTLPPPPPATHTIDYSQPYGPVLPVTFLDKTHRLKMYTGETPSTALKRFCGMLALNDAQCTQVKLAYFELCLENGIDDPNLQIELSVHLLSRWSDGSAAEASDESAGDTIRGSKQGDADMNKAGSSKTPVAAESKSKLHKDYKVQLPAPPSSYADQYPAWLRWLLAKCAEHWSLIALVIAILCIATEHAQ